MRLSGLRRFNIELKSEPFSPVGSFSGTNMQQVIKTLARPHSCSFYVYWLKLFVGLKEIVLNVKGGGSETEVTWEDQQNINKFGRLNNRFHELDDEIKIAKVLLSLCPAWPQN